MPVTEYRTGGPTVTVHHADAIDVLRRLPAESVHAVCCDPPYSLAFMAQQWDSFTTPAAYQAWCQQWATECLRVLAPGGHMAAFGGTRTSHRLTCAIEDAGFDIRDTITWVYGSGFPKSRDIGKDIDRMAGAAREIIGQHPSPAGNKSGGAALNMSLYGMPETADLTAPATDAAKQWDGWGTALKPASEPITLARKPFPGSVAANVLQHGTGAININGCRVGNQKRINSPAGNKPGGAVYNMSILGMPDDAPSTEANGRWPPNLVLSHAATEDDGDACVNGCVEGCPVLELDTQSGITKSSTDPNRFKGVRKFTGNTYANDSFSLGMTSSETVIYGDSGGASRYFPCFRYQAKAPRSERPVILEPDCECEKAWDGLHLKDTPVRIGKRQPFEHVYIWEKHHNRPVPPGHDIHHRDGNKLNNDIENLELVTKLEHKRIHSGCELRNGEWWKPCGICRTSLPLNSSHFYLSPEGWPLYGCCRKCHIQKVVDAKRLRKMRKTISGG